MTNLTPNDLHAAIERAYVVVWQARRLEETQIQSYKEAEARVRGNYGADDRLPFHRLAGDRRFFLLAVNDLKRALDKIGYGSRMPANMAKYVRLVRNCNEHWNDASGPSLKGFAALGGTDPFAHTWGAGGTVLGEFVEVDKLAALAQHVYDDLVELERKS